MYITQNSDSKLLRQNLKHLVKVHTIDMIPTLWRTYVLKIINLHMLTFRQDENKFINIITDWLPFSHIIIA